MLLSYTAAENDCGRTVHSIVRREFRASTSLLRRLKAAGAIAVSGAPVFTDYRVTPGETVTADIDAAERPCDNVPEQGSFEILFENEGLIAVNKPAGVIVHPTHSRNTGTLSNFVAGYLLRTAQPCSCHAVNRLDRDTSGVVLFAKNSYVKALASEALADSGASKEYLALVHGAMPESGAIDVPIRRLEERNMLRVASPDGQRAVTRYETVRTFGAGGESFSLVLLRLETGRTHQIRVHCSHVGHPVLGDKLYCTEGSRGLSQRLGVETQALHAYRLAFADPLSGQRIVVAAPVPELFKSPGPAGLPL